MKMDYFYERCTQSSSKTSVSSTDLSIKDGNTLSVQSVHNTPKTYGNEFPPINNESSKENKKHIMKCCVSRNISSLVKRIWSCHKFKFQMDTPIIRNLIVLLFIFTTLIDRGEGIEWLAVAKRRDTYWNHSRDCRVHEKKVLNRFQQKMCVENLDLMVAVVHSSLQTAQTCQELFIDNRWNCSNILQAPNYWPDLTEGTREQAVVQALASAALTQAIAKTCSSGYSKKCSCYRGTAKDKSSSNIKWSGCGDDVQFAVDFAQRFTDQQWQKGKNKSKKAMINLHNNRVGRKIMEDSLKTVCKCHGTSGSCSVKTCWKALPDLKAIGEVLMTKYSDAVKVDIMKVPLEEPKRFTRSIPREEIVIEENSVVDYGGEEAWNMEYDSVVVKAVEKPKPKLKNFKRILAHSKAKENIENTFSETDLVFGNLSPDYCSEDLSAGSLGTVGRECQKNETNSGGCKSMCCGRGYVNKKVEVQYRCDCKYYWCCYVKCKVCSKIIEVSRCR